MTDIKQVECLFCNLVFSSNSEMFLHRRFFHMKEMNETVKSEFITLTEYKRYLILHDKYQSKVNDHISDCFCTDCLIRNSISQMIVKNRVKHRNA